MQGLRSVVTEDVPLLSIQTQNREISITLQLLTMFSFFKERKALAKVFYDNSSSADEYFDEMLTQTLTVFAKASKLEFVLQVRCLIL